MKFDSKKKLFLALASIVLSIVLGFIIGFFSAPRNSLSSLQKERLTYYENLIKDDDLSFFNMIQKETNADFIRRNLEFSIIINANLKKCMFL